MTNVKNPADKGKSNLKVEGLIRELENITLPGTAHHFYESLKETHQILECNGKIDLGNYPGQIFLIECLRTIFVELHLTSLKPEGKAKSNLKDDISSTEQNNSTVYVPLQKNYLCTPKDALKNYDAIRFLQTNVDYNILGEANEISTYIVHLERLRKFFFEMHCYYLESDNSVLNIFEKGAEVDSIV